VTDIPGQIITRAVRALLGASRFAEADDLLRAAGAADHPDLALVRAEAELARDWHHGRVTDVEVLRAAAAIVARSDDVRSTWTMEFLFVRRDYTERFLTRPDRDGTGSLVQRAAALRDTAPDEPCRGWAEFYLGLIADNVADRRGDAPAHYLRSLEAAERHHDDLLIFESLRHLGDHAHDDADPALARRHWERATRHAARAGHVAGTLAQQLLLAVLARDRGDETAALLLAGEVNRWADAIRASRTESLSRAFLAGQDPTRPPAPAGR
jgi:hypothetical protein